MLQPRSETYCNLLCTNILKYFIILNVLIQPFGLTQYVDSGFSVSPTPVLRLKDNEFTTVVLLKSKQSELNGRYFNLKPELGLLTSTARTFIQEGVTTEYATQVVGTTLKNGDLYAQFIKKSSRVLYDKNSITPSAVTSWVGEVQTRILPQSHNDLAYSNEPEWQNVEDRLLNDSVVYIVNTDQARERKLNSEQKIEEASYLGTQDLRSSSSYVTTSSAPLIIPVSVGDGKLNNNQIDKGRIVGARKVLQIADLPTYTVKNNFFPSGLENKTTQWVYSDAEQYNDVFDRVPKDFYTDANSGLQRNNSINVKQNSANRILATTTYYGFAEFTTSVGDSVIIFLPSTAQRHENFGHITSISGEATLDISSSSITVVSNSIKATPTSTNLLVETKYMQNNDIPIITNIETQIINTSESIAGEESSTVALESSEAIDFLASSSNTETLSATQSFSLPSPEEISKIYAMLGKSETTSTSINSSKEPLEQSNGQSTETLGGATTIFFEDDIFGNFVEPSKIENNFVEPSNLQTGILTTPKSVELNAIPVTTPTTDRPAENNFGTTTEKPEETTTAESLNEEDTTTSNVISEVSEDTTTEKTPMLEKSTPNVIIKEVKIDDMDDSNCIYTSQVFLTQVPKSVTEAENTIPSFDIEEVTKHYCIQSSKTSFIDKTVLPPVTEQPQSSSAKNSNTESAVTTPKEELPAVTTPKEELSEDIVQTTTVGSEVDYDDDDYENSKEEFLEEEIELIYKTLYTTYTYLTTFFNDDTTTVSSHTEIITKTITSTVNVVDEIKGTAYEGVKSTESQQSLKEQTLSTGTIENSRYHLIPSDFDTLLTNDADSNDKNTAESTSSKAFDKNHTAKTYYTTYTYYTTIFADNESEIITRSEVFTNVLNIAPTKVANAKIELTTTVEMNDEQLLNTKEISESTTRIQSTQIVNSKIIEGDASVQLVMGVESSSSDGDIQLIDTQKNQDLNLFEDQISSESNTEEIIPSATLLLQTSFTTFTYYTTMYGTDGSNIISRLETVTNVVTETLQPTKTLNVQEGVLPVTYFTTFTYWTKLAKDGEITTLSREETISNVVLPTSTNVNQVFGTEANFVQQKLESNSAETVAVTTLSPILLSTDTIDSETLKPTTYYTTYTYYTTSYDLNETVTHSRLETVTNVETPVLTPTVINSNIPKETTSNQIESLEKITPTNSPAATIHLYDVKKIIDAEGISTLYFTTQILPTVNEFGIATEILSTTSSLYVDEDKKASVGTSSATPSLNEDGSTIRQYKTGLVRLIEGTRIGNLTTTLYQSKVIGTVIDNRYAQIIESTSSFIYENKTPYPFENVGTKTETTKVPETDDQEKTVTPDLGIIQSSITDQTDSLETKSVAAEQSDEITNKELQTANRVFSPVIRPFVSRNRPQFAPKKKILAPSSATIISRSDFIPTITATPALKTTGRFSTLRRTSNVAPSSTLGQSSRRFSRPSRLSSGSNNVLATQSLYSSSSLNSKNRFASSRISSVSKRLSTSLRPTSTGYGASNRFRFKPSTITPQLNSNEGVSTPDSITSDDDENVTLEVDINQEETTTENSRRNQNPLLRFRRPLNRPSGFTPSTAQRASSSSSAVSPKRNPLTSRIKTTTTTTTTTTTSRPRQRSFARPPISLTQNRPRTSNNLFPPRTLFQLQKPSNSTNVKSESNKNNQNDSENDSEYEDDEEDGEFDSEEEGSRTKRSTKNPFEVRPEITKFRTKRNVEDTFQSRDNFRSRFRRPKILKSREEDQSPEEITESMTDVTKPLGRSRISSRFGSRNLSSNQKTSPVTTTTTPNNHRAVRPTRPTSSRTQFTLREKDTTPSSPRGQTRPTSNNLRKPTSNLRRTSPANSSFNRRFSTTNSHETSTRNYRGRNSNLGNSVRSRTSTSRSRSRNDFNPENFIPDNGGTITVTHYLPSEVTIPVVNGKITEYKNVITAKSSTEVLGPQQYTSFIGKNGHSTLALAREYSTINYAGATEVTQFIIHESDTTSVIFTPTTIRGRKTSFSHVIPSTVYSVESITSTYNPQISANAPLANILLSQLLLGQIGLPSNPLLGAFGGIAQSSVDGQQGPVPTQATPMTEYRTHSSTYITTLYEGMSTVLPVTFQGKKILTTIYETSAQTITATEFITDTIVTTPSQISPQQPPQINSLLLQQLLLQQQLQQQQPEQTRLPFAEQMSVEIPTNDDIEEFGSVNLQGTNNNINLDDNSLHEESNQNQKSTKKKSKKSGKSHRRNKQQQQNLEDAINHDKPETSVITLYVSGRRPGEFSTVLSTVTADYDATIHKRHAQNTGTYDNPNNFYNTDKEDDVFDENILSTTANAENEILLQLISPSANTIINNDVDRNAQNDQTESLESIVGDINMWHQKNTGSISSNVPKTTQIQNQQSRTFLV